MFLNKLKLVLWKNYIIRRRHWFLSICEAVIPVLLFLLIAYGRSQANLMGREIIHEVSETDPIYTTDIYNGYMNEGKLLLYTPQTNFTENLIDEIREKLNILHENSKGFHSENELHRYYEKFASNRSVMAVIFLGDVQKVPRKLEYDIRFHEKGMKWDTQKLFVSTDQYIPLQAFEKYQSTGFLPLQLAIDTSYIEQVTAKKDIPFDITFQEFPYPPYIKDAGISDLFMYFLPLVTIFSFILLCPAVIKRVAEEKYTGIKELMKMVGLKSWMLWLGWFIHAFAVNILSVVAIVVLLKVPFWNSPYPPIEHCSFSVLAVFLLLYCAASIAFCFTISTLFSRPTIAMICGILSWILTYFIPSNIISKCENMSWGKKVLFAIFPNMALEYGYSAISVYETRQLGVNWDNISQSPDGGDKDITMLNVFVALILDIAFYMLLAVYVENINPGKYGLAKPWHYPVSSLLSQFLWKESSQVEDVSSTTKVEEAPLNLEKGIKIQNVYKKYGKHTAVDGITIDIYKDQITALLGHNGAGKSTTMSIITGMISATKGTVIIDGYDIRKNMDQVRSELGLCPQHNLHFTDLTVLEHLKFFAMLKGLSGTDAVQEAEKLLCQLNLTQKKDYLPGALSGGMKRKLNLAMALIGKSKVLILDEPTSGMDPEARRLVWDLLLSCRGSRTILITTHFMEEADVLGDRIAIMDHGHIICYGSPMFLKHEYGTGYNLTIVRGERTNTVGDGSSVRREMSQTEAITSIVQTRIRSAKLKSNNGNMLTYLLPNEEKARFHEVLYDLEQNKEDLGIASISVSVTTLEEVFLRAGTKAAENAENDKVELQSISSKRSRGMDLFLEHIQGLFQKRGLVFLNRKLIHLVQLVLACAITMLTLGLGQGASDYYGSLEHSINLDVGLYGKTKVICGVDRSGTEVFAKMQNFCDRIVTDQLSTPYKTENVSQVIVQEAVNNIAYYKNHMVVALDFKSSKNLVNIMFSNFALHGPPIALNLASNAIIKSLAGEEYGITMRNAPLRAFNTNHSPKQLSEVEVSILWLMLFPIGILFVIGGFIIFPQLERASNVIQLQLMCGIRAISYWFYTWVFDLLVFVLMIIVLLLCVAFYEEIFGCGTFSGRNELGTLFLILLCYAVTAIPYTYLFSYKKSVAGGFAALLISGMFIGVVLTVVVNVMQLSGDAYYERLGNNLKYFFLLMPQFGLTYCLVQFSRKAVRNYNWEVMSAEEKSRKCHFDYNPCCSGIGTVECSRYQSYLQGNDLSVGSDLAEMAASFVIYFGLILLLESGKCRILWDKILLFVHNIRNTHSKSYDMVDSPNRSKDQYTTPLLEATNLEKIYGGNKVVKNVSFKVKPGDCFGLLGVNGAGKTTTFRMLTGDEPLTGGTANIQPATGEKFEISRETTEYLKNMGYCPQFNAINHVLTGRQTLQVFARLRGIPKEDINAEVDNLLEVLGLEEIADKPCGDYSGGNKRKLCIALALIGGAPLILLDEPTSGVDPVSRRKMWDILTCIKNSENKSSIVLTSHSMEECEALCDTLAIMKEGNIHCQDTIPRLKQQFGKGYTVLLKLKSSRETDCLNEVVTDNGLRETSNLLAHQDSPQTREVMIAMEDNYKQHCTLRDKHAGLLHYHISTPNKRWSEIFREIEEIKQKYPIVEDYSVSETSLEDVFLSVAKNGSDEELDGRRSKRSKVV